MTDYGLVLAVRYRGVSYSLGDVADYSTLVWSSDVPKPSQAELDAAWPDIRDGLAWDRVRSERDRLLAACDWTQVADAPVDAAAWAAYRQALRDVPQDFDSPDDVVWPTPPA